jgi:hypothetical protein
MPGQSCLGWGKFWSRREIFPLASINLGETQKNQLVLGLQISLFYNFVLALAFRLYNMCIKIAMLTRS